jgi:regulator of protease activity HflC (stomatin/prohibitin superfamily)
MNKYLLFALVLIVAVVVTALVIQHPSQSGEVPNLDAAAIDTGKNLHPPTLNP